MSEHLHTWCGHSPKSAFVKINVICMNGNTKHQLWAVNYIPAYCSGFCKCLGSCVPLIRWGEHVPKQSAAVTATDPRPPACRYGCARTEAGFPAPWPFHAGLLKHHGPSRRSGPEGQRAQPPRAPSAPQRIGCGGGRPAGPAGVPRAGHCL